MILNAVIGVLLLIVAPAAPDVQQPENRAREIYARALRLQTEGNQPAALSLLWEAAGLAPHDADVQNSLGEALERIGALDAAVAAYRTAVAERPAFRKASNNLILALARAGKGEEAVARARALVVEAPEDADAYFTLGLAQSEQDVSAAIASFRRALQLDPGHTLARYNLARVLSRTDRISEAIEELTRALAIEPRPEAHYTLGVIYWHTGDLDRAARELRAAIAGQPDYAEAHYTLGAVLKARRDWAGAATELRRAIALRPDAATHYTLAQVLQQAGDTAGAQRNFADAERLRQGKEQEQQAAIWTSVGTARLDAADFTGAVDLFRRAVAIRGDYAPAYYQMGRALQQLGRAAESRAAFAKAAALNPSLIPAAADR